MIVNILCLFLSFFFFKQKTAYEIYQCDWSSDVCSSDLKYFRNRIIPATVQKCSDTGVSDGSAESLFVTFCGPVLSCPLSTGKGVVKLTTHDRRKWDFRSRFRAGAFGWRSQPAIKRVKEAVSEIRKAARKDPVHGAEGAVLFLEKISPALQRVDSSSGAIGSAVNTAIDALVPIIVKAPADDGMRDAWLERLWDAYNDDDIPYIELLADSWGELCVTPERASRWADDLLTGLRASWVDRLVDRKSVG